ncbi:MAG: alkaline shock response membrane anchor protein AmaP [Atopobiaceae bacterium]|nr:alkaline shock response membrane anchor protein AmaP [Atopobiaceae bacterium]
MNWFKRLCLFVFGLSGVLSLLALSLVWVGPWTTQARSLITETRWYFVTLEVLVCVSAVGLVACVLVALFAPRNPKATVVAEVDGGKITVTRAAIATQTRHVIEADGTCEPVSIHVRVRKRGHIKVHARVRPHLPVDVVERGEILYSELEQGLAKVCGDSVEKISIVFTEPAQQGTLSTYVDTDDSPRGSAASTVGQSGQDITVAVSPRVEAPATVPTPVEEPLSARAYVPDLPVLEDEADDPTADLSAAAEHADMQEEV